MDLAAIIISIFALGVAVMYLFQMLGGIPDIEIRFEGRDVNDGRTLLFSLRNRPITNKFLRMMNVYRRQVENPFFIFNIKDDATKAQIREENLRLSQSWNDFKVIYTDNNGYTRIMERDNQILPGKYHFELSIRADDYDKK
jgi:hypothetical protein